MTKIKIAAVVMCMIATGAFAGFTYKTANHSKDNVERVAVRTVSEDEITDEVVTDEETTDDEVTAEEEITTEEETVVIELKEPVVTTAVKSAKAEKKTETEKAKETSAAKSEKTDDEVFNTLKKEMAAAPAVTTAPVVTEVPEIIPETEAPVVEEVPVIEEVPSEPVYEEPVQTEETQPAEEPVVTEAPAEETQPAESEEEPVEEVSSGRKVQVTDEEYIWLCNVVGHEYGSDWIPIEEKAKVVEAVMNRVNDPRFPNTIWGVLTQPYQFSGLEWTLYLGTFSYQVTDSVKAAVDLYLEHPEQFNHGYNSFWGDGSMNHFYAI